MNARMRAKFVWPSFIQVQLDGWAHQLTAHRLHFVAMEPSTPIAPTDQSLNDETSDAQLMLAYRAGDMAAFDTLYAKHRKSLYQFVARLTGSTLSVSDCDELYQDVWLRVIDARERYVPTAQFRTWLYTIAHHRVMDHLRARNVRFQVVSNADADGTDDSHGADAVSQIPASRLTEPSVQAQSRQQGQAILQALAALPIAQRETFLLYEESGLSVQEIADATGTSFEATKSRLRYAFAKLREQLKEYV
jgi:RNA polymerase sigma-70 factor, ECF subfamily